MAVEIEGGGSFTPCPAGMWPAWCYAVVELGTQPKMFNGEMKYQKKIWLGFELPTQKKTDGKPFLIGMVQTPSLAPSSTLRKMLKGWRGRDFTEDELKKFNLSAVIGKACQLIVVHNPKSDGSGVSDSISAIQPAPRGGDGKIASLPALQEKTLDFDIKDWKDEVYQSLPNWVKKRIGQSPEGAAKLGANSNGATTTGGGPSTPPVDDQSIPF